MENDEVKSEREIIETMIDMSHSLSGSGKTAVVKALTYHRGLFEDSAFRTSLQAQVETLVDILNDITGKNIMTKTRIYPIPYCRYIIGIHLRGKGYSFAQIAEFLPIERCTLCMGATKTQELLIAGYDRTLTDIYRQFKERIL